MRRVILCLLVAACGDDGEAGDTNTPGTTTSTMETTSMSTTTPSTMTDPPATTDESGDPTTTGPGPVTGSEEGSGSTTEAPLVCNEIDDAGPSFVDTVWPILMDRCQAPGQVCHQNGSAVLGLDLDMAEAYNSLVCVEAGEADVFRVNPGDPERSYWLAKLEGRQTDLGGAGVQMPLGMTPLLEAELTTIREWIMGGAAP